MSRKTKKEKIAAEGRRKGIADTYQISSTFVQKPPINVIQTGIKPYSIPETNTTNTATTIQNNYAYVTSDLKRILLFTALAFCAQLVLWYFLGNKI